MVDRFNSVLQSNVVLMFGMMMGRGNSKLRVIRIGLLVMIVLAGILFNHTGRAYETIRIVYYIAIVGFLFFGFRSRRRAGIEGPGGFGNRSNRMGNPGAASGWGTSPSPTAVEAHLVEPETPGKDANPS